MALKKMIVPACILLLLLGGIGLLAYPSLANYINNAYAVSAIGDYQEKIDHSDQNELKDLMAMAYAYNDSLPGAFPADPFSGQNISKQAKEDYHDLFMIQPGAMIGYVEIPTLDIYLPIYYGTDDTVLEKGVGLIENSSLPIGANSSHAVLSAHTGLPSQELFTGLEVLKTDDMFFIHVLDQVFAYRVDQSKVVLPDETQDLMIEKDKTQITLLTCTPYGINSHRLLVRGQLDPNYDFSTEAKIPQSRKQNDWLWMVVLGTAAAGVVAGSVVFLRKRKRRGEAHEE